MAYVYLSDTEFSTRYQLLADYVQDNGDTLTENELLLIKDYGLDSFLPDGYALKGKNLFALNSAGKSFSHIAAAEGNCLLITFLKETGHDINHKDSEGKTPLCDASAELKLGSVDVLLGYGANPNLGNDAITLEAMRREIKVSYQGENVPLVAVIESRATVTAAEFIAASPPGEDFSGLTDEQATKRAAATIVKNLLAKGAQINLQTGIEEYSALHRAIDRREPLIVKEICDSAQAKNSNIFSQFDRDGEAALHMVVAYRNKEEKEDEQAEMQKEKEITDIIISHAESNNIQQLLTIKELFEGNTPIHAAVICSNFDVVKDIYKSDYKFSDKKILSIQNNKGNTAIHEAVIEAWRGPKILRFLLSVATEDDLNIKNSLDAKGKDVGIGNGESVKELADRFLNEADPVCDLIEDVETATVALEQILDKSLPNEDKVKVQDQVAKLFEAVKKLEEHDPFDDRKSEELSQAIEVLSAKLENDKEHALLLVDDAEDLVERARKLIASTENEFFHEGYLDSLKSVKQEEYFAWKAEQLKLPSSFPHLETVDNNLLNPPRSFELTFDRAHAWYQYGYDMYTYGNYPNAISGLINSIQLYNENQRYSNHRALALAHDELANVYLAQNYYINTLTYPNEVADNNKNARENLEKAIEIFHTVKDYNKLEPAYQKLARTYVSEGDLAIANYEEANRIKLRSRGRLGQLRGHLALAGLYKELNEQAYVTQQASPLPMNDLPKRASLDFQQAFKLTQGRMDDSALTVLQREIGVAKNVKLGTYNIQQCVAIVAFDPISEKVVLSHFDKYSGPASFIDQLDEKFPGKDKVHLYISGGRDRSLDNVKTSDNNIDQVLKQFHLKNVEDSTDGNPKNGRFQIKFCDVGDKPSPEAIVFDVWSQRLIHAVPNRADSSLESRAVNFMLQKNKAGYLRPLNPVDFAKSEAERTVRFSVQELQTIRDKTAEWTRYYANSPHRETWKQDQIFYPLMKVIDEAAGLAPPDFSQGVLTEFRRNYYQGIPVVKDPQINDEDNIIYDDDLNKSFRCLGNRRRREAGLCTLDSEHLLEELPKLSEAKQSEVLEHVATRRVGGTKQKEVETLVHNQKETNHLQKAEGISSAVMDGLFDEDALAKWFNGDRFPAVQLGGLKGLNHVLGKVSAKMEAKGLEWLAAGKTLRANFLRSSIPFVNRAPNLILVGYDLYEQASALQKNPNNTDALVGVVSDGIQLGTDLITGGIQVAEISSETFALLGLSEFTGPIGGGVVAIVIVGDKIYAAVEKVDGEDHVLHLSKGEKLTEGMRAFLSMNSAFQKQIDEIKKYETDIFPQQFELLKNHTDIKHVVFPAIKQTGSKTSCMHRGFSGKGCKEYRYTPLFSTVEESSVSFKEKRFGFKLLREELTAPTGSEFLCLPSLPPGDTDGRELPEGGAFDCNGALGLTNTNSTGKTAFFNLGEGKRYAIGFDDRSNIFMVNESAIDFQGGKQDDIFIVQAKQIETVIGEAGVGGLNGMEGSDSLLLEGFQPAADYIEVNLPAGYLKYGNKTLPVTNIEKLFGGTPSLVVTAAADTQEIHLAGGSTLANLDTLLIPKNNSNAYDLKMYLRPPANVTNEAEVGKFTYYILPGKGSVAVNLAATEDSPNTQHQFIFNTLISNVTSIAFSDKAAGDEATQAIQLNFEDFTFELSANLSNTTRFNFIDNAELKIGKKNLYLFQQIQRNFNQSIAEIIDKYSSIELPNLMCVLSTQDIEQIVIGHSGKEVMQNNPNAIRTHLIGNGGEGLFVIQSGMESLFQSRLPINEVVLYRRPEDRHIDTLDFRTLNAQVQARNNVTAKILFVTPNSENRLGHDLLILFGIVSPYTPRNKVIEVITVRLKDAMLNHWYKKYLHVILNDNRPQQIVGRHSRLHLKPLPLKFEPQHEIASVGVESVDKNTHLIIPTAYQAGAFFQHNQTNLLWTNTLSNRSNTVEPFTLIVEKFFLKEEESKLETLSLQFTDKEIVLKDKLAEINLAADFEEAKDSRLAGLRAASLAIMGVEPLPLYPPTSQRANASEIEVRQENYLDSDTNATSIESSTDNSSNEETNEIASFVRERRSIADISDSVATSSASRLHSWIDFPRSIAENVVRTAGEIFNYVGSNIMNLNLLNQVPLLGNKTSNVNDQLTSIQEYVLDAQDVPLKNCVPLTLMDIDQAPIDGVSCSIHDATINFFHNTPFETRPTAFEQPEDNFANCRPLEWYGRPSVACEGEKTTAIVTPHLPARIFDPVDGWLMLGQLTVAIFKKFFSKAAITDTRYQLVDVSLMKQELWDAKLNTIESQLQKLYTQIDMQQLKWIQYRLEDRQEELEQFIKCNQIPWNKATEFTENLFELEEMLNEVKEIPQPTSSSFQPRDNDVFARAASNGNYQNNMQQPEAPTVSRDTLRAKSSSIQSSFFGLTQFSGFFSHAATNPSNTALLTGPTQTQGVVIHRLHS